LCRKRYNLGFLIPKVVPFSYLYLHSILIRSDFQCYLKQFITDLNKTGRTLTTNAQYICDLEQRKMTVLKSKRLWETSIRGKILFRTYRCVYLLKTLFMIIGKQVSYLLIAD